MEEKIKVYVDSNEKDFITDCYLADNTKIICEFYHEESEIEYSNCKLLNLQEYDKQKDQRIAELEQELAELKEKAIARPKFKHFEEYWYIENNPYCDNELQVFNGKVMEIICAYDEDWLYEYRFDTSCRYIEEDNIFATEQEAQAKLKEIKGNE